MLLILTNSDDGTTDEIVRRVGTDKVFRFNIDLWNEYEINVSPEGIELTDPTGRECNDSNVKAVYLRKPTFDDPLTVPEGGCPEDWLRSQIYYLSREIYNHYRDVGLVRLVEKGAQNRFGKFCQLRLAQQHFNVPPWKFIKTSGPISFPEPCITKPLTADFIGDYNFVFTRSVTPQDLDPDFPWLLQEKIEAESDVTVVFVDGKCFAFELDRTTFEGVDWRKHINSINLVWNRVELKPDTSIAIRNYMDEANLQFGRLDFLRKDQDLYFLEVNPNGQWAWLDLEGIEGIFDAVIECLTKDWNEIR